jgi:hypothetical protein
MHLLPVLVWQKAWQTVCMLLKHSGCLMSFLQVWDLQAGQMPAVPCSWWATGPTCLLQALLLHTTNHAPASCIGMAESLGDGLHAAESLGDGLHAAETFDCLMSFLQVWDLQAGQMLFQSSILGAAVPTCLAVDAAAARLAMGCADGSVRQFDFVQLPVCREMQVSCTLPGLQLWWWLMSCWLQDACDQTACQLGMHKVLCSRAAELDHCSPPARSPTLLNTQVAVGGGSPVYFKCGRG